MPLLGDLECPRQHILSHLGWRPSWNRSSCFKPSVSGAQRPRSSKAVQQAMRLSSFCAQFVQCRFAEC